jgi:RNA polymerase sigma-70 factor (ECF subfamily)
LERQRQAESGTTTGDEEFDGYFRTVYWPIVRALGTAHGDVEAAREATQDAFQRAYIRWRRVRRSDSPVAWIRREAISHLDAAERPRDDPSEPTSATQAVGAAFAGLPPEVRMAVVLSCLEDLPDDEVARSMGISEGAVRAHVDRGRARLAAALGSGDGGDETVDG